MPTFKQDMCLEKITIDLPDIEYDVFEEKIKSLGVYIRKASRQTFENFQIEGINTMTFGGRIGPLEYEYEYNKSPSKCYIVIDIIRSHDESAPDFISVIENAYPQNKSRIERTEIISKERINVFNVFVKPAITVLLFTAIGALAVYGLICIANKILSK